MRFETILCEKRQKVFIPTPCPVIAAMHAQNRILSRIACAGRSTKNLNGQHVIFASKNGSIDWIAVQRLISFARHRTTNLIGLNPAVAAHIKRAESNLNHYSIKQDLWNGSTYLPSHILSTRVLFPTVVRSCLVLIDDIRRPRILGCLRINKALRGIQKATMGPRFF